MAFEAGHPSSEQHPDPLIAPPPIERRAARVSTSLDLNPPVIYAGVTVLLILAASIALWRHPQVFANAEHGMVGFFAKLKPAPAPIPVQATPIPSPPLPLKPRPEPSPHSEAEAKDRMLADAKRNETLLREEITRRRYDQDEQDRKNQAIIAASAKSAVDAQKSADAAAEALRLANEKTEEARLAAEQAEKQAIAAAHAVTPAPPPSARTPLVNQPLRTQAVVAAPYDGPRFGTIHWQGEVHGTELITIEDGRASTGTVTGRLPGVPVLVQPVNSKKVGIASPPSPENSFRSMVFRVNGNGSMQLNFDWTLP